VKPQSAKQQSAAKLQGKFTAISTPSEEKPASERSDRPPSCRGNVPRWVLLLARRKEKMHPKPP